MIDDEDFALEDNDEQPVVADEPEEGSEAEEEADAEGEEEQAAPATKAEAGTEEEPRKGRDHWAKTLRQEARQAKEHADRVQRELAEMRAQTERQKLQAQQASEEERLALMTDGEKAQYFYQKTQVEQQQLKQQLEFQKQDMADRTTFSSKAAADPRYAKYQDAVEAELQAIRHQWGFNLPREAVLAFLVGKRVLDGQGSAKAQQAKGKQTVTRQRTAPPKGNSDAGGRQRQGKSLEDRLADVPI